MRYLNFYLLFFFLMPLQSFALTVKQGGLSSSTTHPTISACVEASSSALTPTYAYSWTTGVELVTTNTGYKYGISYKAFTFERIQCSDHNSLSCSQRQFTCTAYPIGEAVWPEPADCPEAGSIQRLTTVINGKMVDGVFVEDDQAALDDRHFSGNYYDGDNCKYSPSYGGSETESNSSCGPFKDGSIRCSQDLFSVGLVDDPSVIPANNPPTFLQDDTQSPETDRSKDNRQNTVNETSLDPVTEMLPDGSTQKTETTVTTENRGNGTVVVETSDTTTIVDTDGITKQQTVTTTTTTNPDGSETTVITTDYSFTQHPQTVFTVSNDGDSVTNSYVIGQTIEGNTKQTIVRDENGKIVSQSTEENDSEARKAQVKSEAEEAKDDKCSASPNSPECFEGEFKKTDKGSFPSASEVGSAQWNYDQAVTELNDLFADIQTQVDDKLGLTLTGGSSTVEGDSLSWSGEEYSSGGGILNLINWFDFMNISTLVLLGAALFAFMILTDR